MEKKTIWLVQAHATYGISTHYAFDTKQKARKKYKEVVNTLRNHKPNESDHWTYKVIHEVDDGETIYTVFEASWNGTKETFAVYYEELEVQ